MNIRDNIEFDDTFLARWAADELTEDELRRFEEHPDYKVYAHILEGSNQFKKEEIDVDKTYAALQIKLKSEKEQQLNRRKMLIWLTASAASLLFIIWFGLGGESLTTHQTAIGERENIQLPDGSIIELNADSKIAYNAKNFLKKRVINLEGEAFFDVTSGAGFEVSSKHATIKVLGTQFNVRNLEKQVEVVCSEGRVEVIPFATSAPTILSAGQGITISENGDTELVESITIAPWRNGRSTFHRTPFNLVLIEFQKQYEIDIETSLVDLRPTFTGSFVHRDMEKAAEMIFLPMNISYQFSGNRLILSNE
jgi:ferric-dicitrate binding protein FerR (iron transport regulator)